MPKPTPQLTENARLELTYLLAANPKPTTAAEAFIIWLDWCTQWQELTKPQATEVLEQTISQLIQTHEHLTKA